LNHNNPIIQLPQSYSYPNVQEAFLTMSKHQFTYKIIQARKFYVNIAPIYEIMAVTHAQNYINENSSPYLVSYA